MEISIFHAVISRKHLPAERLFQELEEVLPGLFTDLLRMEGGGPYAKLALMYIIYAYSKESPLIVLGTRSADLKRKIADYVQLPDMLIGPVMKMQNPIVQDTVVSYLNAQQDRRWQHLVQDKELYEAMLDSGIKSMRDDKGNVDFKGMVAAAKHRKELREQIEEQEAAFRAEGEYEFVKENMEEIKKISKESASNKSMRLENSPNIK